jgi:Family of unknown function (DUF6174)
VGPWDYAILGHLIELKVMGEEVRRERHDNYLNKRTALSVRPRPIRIMIVVAVLVLGGILGQSAASSSWQSTSNRNEIQRALSKARARWIAHRPTSYEFVLSLPEDQGFWLRRFASYRIASGSSTTLAPPSGPLAEIFHSRNTIDALFDLIVERLDGTSGPMSVTYDKKLGFPTSAFLGDISFSIPTFRIFSIPTQIAEPFVLLQHINHCGFGMPDPTDLRQCPDYSIAMWGDGTGDCLANGQKTTLFHRHKPSKRTAAVLVYLTV